MSFDWQIYRELNTDLAKYGLRTQRDYEKHFAMYGKNEDRYHLIKQVYEDFDWISYKNNYSDLANLSKSGVELHWLQHGRKENRTYYKKKIKTIYIIVNIKTGGTNKYVNDLIKYLDANIVIIGSNAELQRIKFNRDDIVLVQQLLHIDIRAGDLMSVIDKYHFRMMICIHDYCWLNKDIYDISDFCPHSVYMNKNQVMPEIGRAHV